MKTLEQEIRERLRDYLSGRVPFRAFEEWFVDATWDIHKSGSPAGIALAFAIERLIAEYTGNYRTETQLKRALRRYAPKWETKRLPLQPGATLTFGSGQRLRDQRHTIRQSQFAGARRSRVVGFG